MNSALGIGEQRASISGDMLCWILYKPSPYFGLAGLEAEISRLAGARRGIGTGP